MSSIFASQSLRTNDIESVVGGPLDIGRFSTGNVRVGSSDNTVSVGDALLIYVDDILNNYIDIIGTNPLLIGRNAGEITIGSSGIPIILEGQVSISTSGSIPTPNASSARVSQAFGRTFTSTLPPKVYLTYDAGATSTNIITVCLAGFVGIAGAWTGFYYLTSTSSAGVADSKLNWVAIA